MEIRIALGTLILFCGAMFGRNLVSVHQRRARTLSELMDGLQVLQIHMLDHLTPVRTALERSQSGILRALGEQIGSDSAETGWSRFCDTETTRGGRLDSLTETDLEALNRLFRTLGTTAREEQRQAFSAAVRELGRMESEARGDYQKKGRLYTIIGALAGAAVLVGVL